MTEQPPEGTRGERQDTVASSLRFWLVFDPGQPSQRVVEVRGRRVVIGRGEDCDLVLDDPSISHHHAAISVRRGAPPVIEDMGSANGTYVNGQPIRAPVGFSAEGDRPRAELRGGEWLRLGDSIAVVSLVPPLGAEPSSGPGDA